MYIYMGVYMYARTLETLADVLYIYLPIGTWNWPETDAALSPIILWLISRVFFSNSYIYIVSRVYNSIARRVFIIHSVLQYTFYYKYIIPSTMHKAHFKTYQRQYISLSRKH